MFITIGIVVAVILVGAGVLIGINNPTLKTAT